MEYLFKFICLMWRVRRVWNFSNNSTSFIQILFHNKRIADYWSFLTEKHNSSIKKKDNGVR